MPEIYDADPDVVQHVNEWHFLYALRFTFQHPNSAFTFDADAVRVAE